MHHDYQSSRAMLLHAHVLFYKDGNGSDSNSIFLPHFKSNTDTNSDILGYECKTDASNSDIDLIYELTFS